MKEAPKLPREIIEYIVKPFDQTYPTGYSSCDANFEWPSTIAPQLVKKYSVKDPLDRDVTNPEPHERVLPSLSVWRYYAMPAKFRFAESGRRTNDAFCVPSYSVFDRFVSDGMNQNDKAIFITSMAADFDLEKHIKKLHFIYAITQSSDYGASSVHFDVQPIVEGEGNIISLMLENERNRFVYTINNNDVFTLYIKDLPEENCPWYTTCLPVAQLATDILFYSIKCLGNNTYLGLAEGELYSIWLDDNKIIHYAKQKCCSQEVLLKLKNIAVDRTSVTPKGFHPKVALLTVEGNIYITHLCAHQQIIMYPLASCSFPLTDCRFYYHNSKIMAIKWNSYRSPDGSHYSITEWSDNFEFLYLSSLLKKWYND